MSKITLINMVEMEEAAGEAEVVEADIKTKEVVEVVAEVDIKTNSSNIKEKIRIHSPKILEATLSEITSKKVISTNHKILNSSNSNNNLSSTNPSLSYISLLTMNKHSNTIPLHSQNSTKIDIKIKISTKIKIDTKIIIKSTIKSKVTIHIMTNNTKKTSTDMNSLATLEIMVMSMVIRMDNKIIIRRFPNIKAGMFHTSHKVKAKNNTMVSSKPMHLQKNSARIR